VLETAFHQIALLEAIFLQISIICTLRNMQLHTIHFQKIMIIKREISFISVFLCGGSLPQLGGTRRKPIALHVLTGK
jgi:hypothetical protein